MLAPLYKANTIRAGAHVTHMLGALAAGLGMYELINKPTTLGILAILTVAFLVYELLGELLVGVLDKPLTRLDNEVAEAKQAPHSEAGA